MALFYQSATRSLPDGFTFRGATVKDIPSIIHLFQEWQGTGLERIRATELALEWQAQYFRPALDVRLIFDQGEHLIGYIEVWSMRSGQKPLLWGMVKPRNNDPAIGAALLRWAEARIRLTLAAIGQNQPQDAWLISPQCEGYFQQAGEETGWIPINLSTLGESIPTDISGAMRLALHNTRSINIIDFFEKEIA